MTNFVFGDCVVETVVDEVGPDSLAGTGGMTGRANCASNELTKPKLGALTLITFRPGSTDVGVLTEPERTFCPLG